MDSTTLESASVVVSPSGWPFAISRRSLRMIFPERVFGSSGVNMIVLGRAIEPIAWTNLHPKGGIRMTVEPREAVPHAG